MGVIEWFKTKHAELRGLRADAQHMQKRYGQSAVEMCDFAIAAAKDVGLRQKLRMVRRLLVKELRSGKPVA